MNSRNLRDHKTIHTGASLLVLFWGSGVVVVLFCCRVPWYGIRPLCVKVHVIARAERFLVATSNPTLHFSVQPHHPLKCDQVAELQGCFVGCEEMLVTWCVGALRTGTHSMG